MPLRIVQLGVGSAGQIWWEAFERTPAVEVVAAVDPDAEALAGAADRFGLAPDTCFSHVAARWDEVPADLVVDSSPAPGRFDHAVRAFAAGKHVATSAPLASSVDQAERLVETAARQKRTIVVAQPLRFHPLALKLNDIVAEHHLGPVEALELAYRTSRPDEAGPAPEPGKLDPLVVESACHHLDLVRWCLLQDAVEAEAVDENVFTFQMSRGTRVTYRVTIGDGDPTGWLGHWRVRGPRNEMTLADGRLLVGDEDYTPSWDEAGPIAELRMGRLHHVILNHVLLYLNDLAEPGISGANNVNSLAMVAAGLQSQAEGRPVAISAG